jgi:hypothetical protein
MENNFDLDSFVQENGEKLTEELKIIPKEQIQEKLDKSFIYEDSETPIPGEQISNKIDNNINAITKESALDSLITKAAIAKAKKESEQVKRHLTPKERNQVKDQFIESMMYQEGEAFYQKYHHIMDGQTKRRTKARILSNFNKGRYDKYILKNPNNNLNE